PPDLTGVHPGPPALTPYLFLSCDGDHPDLLSFPTRRSSDLLALVVAAGGQDRPVALRRDRLQPVDHAAGAGRDQSADDDVLLQRSEEHTSELQSRENLVCRLLLEKKKQAVNERQEAPGVSDE